MTVLVLAADVREGHRFAMALAPAPALVALPSVLIPDCPGIRGRTFSMVLETPGFLDLPDDIRRGMRAEAAPTLAGHPGGIYLVTAELNTAVST